MFFNHSKTHIGARSSYVRFVSESLVNPLYKPKTLSELKAEMDHTGINPAPVKLRSGIDESVPGIDPMDTPSVVVGGDTFENIRNTRSIVNEYEKRVKDYNDTVTAFKESKKTQETNQNE